MSFFSRCIAFTRSTLQHAKAVNEKSGIPTFFILCDMAGCLIKRGVWPDQYRSMGFESLNAKQRSGHLTNRLERKIERKLCQQKKFGILFRNKYCFYRMYSDFFKRKCFRSDTLTAEQLDILFGENDRFIYKPMESQGGDGFRVFAKPEFLAHGALPALELVRGLQPGIVEPFITQHNALSELYPDAVNPIRVVSVYRDGVCRRIYGTLSLGISKQFANASVDAMSALVDMDTGTVTTNAVDHAHNRYELHPVTGKKIKGFVIPMWAEVISMVDKAAERLPEMGLVSWDIAITPDGPVMIEGNNKGGFYGCQYYEFAEEGIDTETAKLFKPYLD